MINVVNSANSVELSKVYVAALLSSVILNPKLALAECEGLGSFAAWVSTRAFLVLGLEVSSHGGVEGHVDHRMVEGGIAYHLCLYGVWVA